VADLDAALAEQRRYWKFNGIMIIILMCLAVVGLIAGVALGVTAMKGAGVGL
jgi:predicted negative regulator of RcsB-dependent stress response